MKAITTNLVKLDKSWFIDAPCTHLEDLRLIKEMSAFIDRHAPEGAHHVQIQLKDGDVPSAKMVVTKGVEEPEGCTYNLGKVELWFSDIIKSAFGGFPDVISIIW